MVAQGPKPVGGVYRVVAAAGTTGIGGTGTAPGEDEYSCSTIGAIVMDEAATAKDSEAEGRGGGRRQGGGGGG